MPESPDSLIGQPVGPYRVLRRLGRGGMGDVYLARSQAGRAVAIKMIQAGLVGDPGFRQRFRHEIAAARKVSGAFTAAVIDADPDAERPWMATVYVAAPSLKEAVAVNGSLPVQTVLTLAAALTEALQAIHREQLVHRDLKPANVLLAEDGPKVIDFGISRAWEGTRLTEHGMIIGTVDFMSPEQAAGEDITVASDVFSLGGVLLFAATGRKPFGDGTAAVIVNRVTHEMPGLDGVPPVLVPLIERCLAKDPAARPATAELLTELSPRATLIAPGWLPAPVTAMLGDYAVNPEDDGGYQATGTLTGARGGAAAPPRPVDASGAGSDREPAKTSRRRRGLLGAVTAAVASLALIGIFVWRPWAKPAADPPAYATEQLFTDSSDISAVAYFGQFGSVVAALAGVVSFNTAATFLTQNPRRCILTVIFSQVTSPDGVVYANELGPGWSGAENAPNRAAQGGNLHQQLITPPLGVAAGESWTGQDTLSLTGSQVGTNAYHLFLQAQSGSTQRWQLDGQPLTCDAAQVP